MKLTKAQLKEATRILTSRAGSIKSEAKAKSSRENGKLGGRPKKEK
jgi:hypothetical protein